MRFVSIKSVEQEDIQAVHRMRAILVRQRTAVINQVRGLLAERGLIIAGGNPKPQGVQYYKHTASFNEANKTNINPLPAQHENLGATLEPRSKDVSAPTKRPL
jgi:transposase